MAQSPGRQTSRHDQGERELGGVIQLIRGCGRDDLTELHARRREQHVEARRATRASLHRDKPKISTTLAVAAAVDCGAGEELDPQRLVRLRIDGPRTRSPAVVSRARVRSGKLRVVRTSVEIDQIIGVTLPSVPRSMPSPPLSKMRLPSIELPLPQLCQALGGHCR